MAVARGPLPMFWSRAPTRPGGPKTSVVPGRKHVAGCGKKKGTGMRHVTANSGSVHSIGMRRGNEATVESNGAPASSYLFSLTMPLTVSLGVLGANATAQPWSVILSGAGTLQTLVVLPILDAIVGQRESLGLTGEPRGKESDPAAYRRVLYIYACVHILVLVAGILATSRLDTLPMIGGILSLGVMGGLGYTTVHELVHGRTRMEHTLASIMLSLMWAMHWRRSHLLHHKNVGKWEDPASARRGENFYAFALRSIGGNVKNGIEDARAKGKTSAPVWWMVCPVALTCIFVLVGGIRAALVFVSQAFVAAITLETVNYIQHYGLERKQNAGGEYEPYSVKHSWNANWTCSNAFAFNLQHHAEHHLNASKPYQKLHRAEGAPQLPLSYPLLMVLSLVPPLFHRIMDSELNDLSGTPGLDT